MLVFVHPGGTVTLDHVSSDAELSFDTNPKATAWGKFDDAINTTGWSTLEIETNRNFNDSEQAFAAGYVEGFLTQKRIMQSIMNNNPLNSNGKLLEFEKKNKAWLETMVEKNSNDMYWHQIGLLLKQIYGIGQGFNQAAPQINLPEIIFYLISQDGDMETLEAVMDESKTSFNFLFKQHCSALIKLLPDYSDIFIAHDTWTGLETMLRVYKKYSFHYRLNPLDSESVIPSVDMTFSSYPGAIYSGDDFYQLSSGLVIQETTNGNNNTDLWQYVTTETVPEGFRNILANRLATNGETWTSLFALHNSGTYNNQWMILDYNQFTPGAPPTKDLLWILEQIPGYTKSADVTNFLVDNFYWPSYNNPYFPEIFNMSGFNYSVETFGDFFDHEKTARAQIFKRDHVNIQNLGDMQYMMRYADFTHDPLSQCKCDPPYSSENTIATRGDLNSANGTWEVGAQGRRNHISSDAKITNYAMHKELKTSAISGPTRQNGNPVFNWDTTSYSTVNHHGQPTIFNFSFQLIDWTSENSPLTPDDQRKEI